MSDHLWDVDMDHLNGICALNVVLCAEMRLKRMKQFSKIVFSPIKSSIRLLEGAFLGFALSGLASCSYCIFWILKFEKRQDFKNVSRKTIVVVFTLRHLYAFNKLNYKVLISTL